MNLMTLIKLSDSTVELYKTRFIFSGIVFRHLTSAEVWPLCSVVMENLIALQNDERDTFLPHSLIIKSRGKIPDANCINKYLYSTETVKNAKCEMVDSIVSYKFEKKKKVQRTGYL